jgi:hypothetical protein
MPVLIHGPLLCDHFHILILGLDDWFMEKNKDDGDKEILSY